MANIVIGLIVTGNTLIYCSVALQVVQLFRRHFVGWQCITGMSIACVMCGMFLRTGASTTVGKW